MRRLLPMLPLVAVLCACGTIRSGEPPRRIAAERMPPAAPVVPVPDTLLTDGATLFVGDLHGTREIPRVVGEIVAAAAADGPVVVALEIPAGRTPALEAFLADDGSPKARQRLVNDAWWKSAYQDGRRSVAIVRLLDVLRALREEGREVVVAGIDTDDVAPQAEPREETLARNVIAVRRAHPQARMIVFAGNLHTSRQQIAFGKGYASMALRVAAAGVEFVSLNPRWASGTAWTCTSAKPEDCGVHYVKGVAPAEAAPEIRIGPVENGLWDGTVGVGAISASPPEGLPELGRGIDQTIAAVLADADAGATR